MDDMLKLIETRRSVRSYKEELPPKELLDEIAKAGTYAASGMGAQSPIILEITNRELRDKLSKLNARVMGTPDKDPFYGAPAVLVVLADKSRPTYMYDGSLVMGNMMLAAHALGLGSCWIHRAKEVVASDEGKEILASLGITGNYEGIGNCIVGYSADPLPPAAPRKENYIYSIT